MELIGAYSNHKHLREKYAELRQCIQETPPRPPLLRPSHRFKRFLSVTDVADIAEKYQSGTTTQQIAADYGISTTRVATVLRDHGITIRRQGLTAEQVGEAATLYMAGRSLSWLAVRYGVSPMTVSTALRRHGIQVRPRPGWG